MMSKVRIIARLDIKNKHVIKGIHLEGLRKVGVPNEMAIKYYLDGADEIIFMDSVAAYYDRNSLSDIIEMATQDVFVPITVGGGIRTIEDITNALKSGADKVAINSQFVKDKTFIKEASSIFGNQCIVASVVAKKIGEERWEAYVDNGREPTGIDVIEWVDFLQTNGAGEIMITSIDKEGTRKGFDIKLCEKITSMASIPVIASGGLGCLSHAVDLVHEAGVDALASAAALHYDNLTLEELKLGLSKQGVVVRK